MKLLHSLLVFFVILLGCQLSPQDAATIAANDIREIAVAERAIILKYCVPKYKEANTPQDVKEADKVCLPAQATYEATKTSWEALLVVLKASKTGSVSDAEVRTAVENLAQTLVKLKQISEAMQ